MYICQAGMLAVFGGNFGSLWETREHLVGSSCFSLFELSRK